MGIRGTTVAGKAAVEGNENSFTLLQDADGGVGQISVSNDGGTQVLSQVGATTTVTSITAHHRHRLYLHRHRFKQIMVRH